MKYTPMNLSDAQIDFLHQAMEGGNSNVSSTLEMLTGQTVDRHSAQIKVIPGTAVMNSMDLGFGPLATVISSIHGDVEADFLFLQNQSDFQTLCQVIGPTLTDKALHTVNDATDYLIPDWLKEQRHNDLDNKDLQSQLQDAISEMSDVLFGTYLTALYSHCKLATYQGLPNATLKDTQQSMLRKALSRNQKESNIAFVIEIECVIAQKSLKTWLLMLPLMSGLRAMLDSTDTASK